MFKKIFITDFHIRLNAWRHTNAIRALCAVFVYVAVLGAAPVYATTINTGETVLTSNVSGAITLKGGTLQADGTRTLSSGISIKSNGSAIDANSYILNFSSNLASNLAGSGSLTLRDSGEGGKIILGAGGSGSAYSFTALDYTGNLTIDSGTVVGNVTNAASVTLNGTYDIGGSGKSIKNLCGVGLITNNGNGTAAGGTATSANISLTNIYNSSFGGVIQNGIKSTNLVIIAELFTQALTGINTFSGTTTIKSGTLNINNTAIPSSTTAVITLGYNSGGTTTSGTLQASENLTLNNPITLVQPGTIDTNDYTITETGIISGGYALTKAGSGTLILSNTAANTYASTTINAGTLQVNAANSLGSGGVIMIDGSTLSVGLDALTITNNIIVGQSGSTGTSTISGLGIDSSNSPIGPYSPIFSGNFTQGGTSSKITVGKSGDTGTFTFNGNMSVPVNIAYGTAKFGGTVPTSITLSGGYLRNNGNDFSGTTLTLADSATSILDVNGSDVSFASALGASSGNLNIGDTTSPDAYSSTSKVYLGGNYSAFTGFIGLYNSVTLGDYPNYIPTDLYFAYGDTTTTNLGTLPNVTTPPSCANQTSGAVPAISNFLARASQGTVSGGPTTTITYTPSGIFNGTDIVTCGFQDLRFFSGDSGYGIGTGGVISCPYPVGGGQITNIRVCPPSAIPSGGITLTDVDFTNFGANFFGSTPAIHGITGVNGFTSASGTATLTVALTNPDTNISAPQRIEGILANGTGTLNLSVTGSSTLTLGGANTYTGTTSIDAGTILIGDIK